METGALCGMQQLTFYLKQLERPYKCVFGRIEDKDCLKKVKTFSIVSAVKNKLRRSKVGMIGSRVNGMTDTSVNEIALKKCVGARIVQIDLLKLLEQSKEGAEKQAISLWNGLKSKAGLCKVSEKEGIDSIKIYFALKTLVEQYNLDALAVGCYPDLMGRVCIASSLLADENIPLACEGDVNGAIGQMILTLLTNQPTHNTDWLDPMDDGTVVFTHCGSGSFSLAEKRGLITLSPVRLMNKGVCALYPAKPGDVTLINITLNANEYRFTLLEGEAVHTEMVFPGNPVKVKFKQSTKDLIEWIHKEGIGHHWMIGYGNVTEEIRNLVDITGNKIKLLEPV
jgi:L-fucose isomerase-like protein